MKPTIKVVLTGLLVSTTLYLIVGILTALIPNPWFIRMTQKNIYDIPLLAINSILLGTYIAISYQNKKTNKTCKITSSTGGIGGFLAASCPICNTILVAIFGSTTLLNYFEPYRPLLGIISSALLITAIYLSLKRN